MTAVLKPFGFTTRAYIAAHIQRVMSNPSATRSLDRGRIAYWHDKTQTVVIHDPNSPDGGDHFQATRR